MTKNHNVCLLGASFSTGNLGVSALAFSCIKLIKIKYPDANINIIGAAREPSLNELEINKKIIKIFSWPVRYTPNIFVANHIVWIYLGLLLLNIFPTLRKYLNSESTLGVMADCELFYDITGGDSFSDIYGFTRFFKAFLLKRACQNFSRGFVMLPQTYGPFNKKITKLLAKKILSRTSLILSRDQEGIIAIKGLIGEASGSVKLCPDVAFILDATNINDPLVKQVKNLKKNGQTIIGLNISGLIYYGGYSRRNEFGLIVDYSELVLTIIKEFVAKGAYVILIPHVYPNNYLAVESDLSACQLIYESLSIQMQEHVLLSNSIFNQSEVKYLIGLCDFFMGARMHSCIAAISQGIPTVGMAYSKKFVGVFETANIADCVIDLRITDTIGCLNAVNIIYKQRHKIEDRLVTSIPAVKEKVMNIFIEM